MYFEYVVDHADQLPLSIHFLFATQAESLEAYAAGDVAKHGFDGAQALAVDMPAHGAVYFPFHFFDQAGLLVFLGMTEFDGELAWAFLLFGPETAFSEVTVAAVMFMPLKLHE